MISFFFIYSFHRTKLLTNELSTANDLKSFKGRQDRQIIKKKKYFMYQFYFIENYLNLKKKSIK